MKKVKRGKREKQIETTAYLPKTLKERVLVRAQRGGVSESAVLREALREYLTRRSEHAPTPHEHAEFDPHDPGTWPPDLDAYISANVPSTAEIVEAYRRWQDAEQAATVREIAEKLGCGKR